MLDWSPSVELHTTRPKTQEKEQVIKLTMLNHLIFEWPRNRIIDNYMQPLIQTLYLRRNPVKPFRVKLVCCFFSKPEQKLILTENGEKI